MTLEQVYEYLMDLIRKNGMAADPETLKKEINEHLSQEGWEVKQVINVNGGFGFDVQPCKVVPPNVTVNPPLTSGQITGFAPVKNQEAKVSGGMSCCRCNSYNAYAEPNREDGTYICYACRN